MGRIKKRYGRLENCQKDNGVNTPTVLYSLLASNALMVRTEVGLDPGADALRIGPDRHALTLQRSPERRDGGIVVCGMRQ
jgi:hypothetical protein